MKQTFEIRAKDAPGLLARVETLFRRQRAPIRSFFFEGGRGPVAVLTIEAEAPADVADLLRRQLMRLLDVNEVSDAAPAAHLAQPEFRFEEKTA
jgi:acetolactate synthase small subunit